MFVTARFERAKGALLREGNDFVKPEEGSLYQIPLYTFMGSPAFAVKNIG